MDAFRDRENGKVFVPNACTLDAQCRLHIVLHGCNGRVDGMAYQTGYNALGALNNIIMLYPDSKCWDNEG